jgi:hypothetical protein
MGSEDSVPPSDGIPLVDAYGILGMAWGVLGITAFCLAMTVELLGMITFNPLGRRGFYTRSSFSEKAPGEGVGHLLRWPWRDGTLCPRAGAINVTHAYALLERRKRK